MTGQATKIIMNTTTTTTSPIDAQERSSLANYIMMLAIDKLLFIIYPK